MTHGTISTATPIHVSANHASNIAVIMMPKGSREAERIIRNAVWSSFPLIYNTRSIRM